LYKRRIRNSSPRFGKTPFSNTKPGRVVLHLMRLITSVVFIFSGVVKAIDPLGTVYKIEDYLVAFDGLWLQMSVLAYPAALFLIILELMVGIQLLLMLRFRTASFFALAFMVIMTPLTFYIALYNPVVDCGCFGDALIITNWQTFFKNVILLAVTVLLFALRKKFKPFFVPAIEISVVFLFLLLSVGFMTRNLMHLPILDFRPFKVGVNIPGAMEVPEGAPADEYHYRFIYTRDGLLKEFELDALPDSSWTFVEQHSTLVNKGVEPLISEFIILNSSYQDIGQEIIDYPGKTYLLVMYDVTKTSAKGIQKVNEFFAARYTQNLRFYGITASSQAQVDDFKNKHWLTFPVYTADPIFLKTIIRANPGIVVIENGTITNKSHWRDLDKIN
jgi:hypothetical protein